MNVSESIDWQHSKPWELDLHRFIAITNSGQTLDGWLKYFPRPLRLLDNPGQRLFHRRFPTRPNRQDNQPLHGRIQIHQRPQGDTETMQRIELVRPETALIPDRFCISCALSPR